MTITNPTHLCAQVLALLRCPYCGACLCVHSDRLSCIGARCGRSFPIVRDIPIILNENTSVFSTDQVARAAEPDDPPHKLSDDTRRRLDAILPMLTRNLKARMNYDQLRNLLLERSPRPRVLNIGANLAGAGIERLRHPHIEIVCSDIVPLAGVHLVCDAHSLPFAKDAFDAVIIQAVLDDLLDPARCVDEIHRVLKPGGVVYVETPFMQPVHDRQYDFMRLTLLGSRRMFRRFEELASGAVGGPGQALALTYHALLLSFVTGRNARAAMSAIARLTGFWLKYLDYYLVDKPGALDAASGVFFMGQKSEQTLADRELIKLYRGGQLATA